MNDQEVRKQIQEDLQDAGAGRGRILYLEGKTDVEILLALLSAGDVQETQRGVLHDGVLLRELGGSRPVTRYIKIAQQHDIRGIFGIIDGDGDPLSVLAAEFDAPHTGPRFRWKGYCIENMLVRASWPSAWGESPDWNVELARYAPYVVINHLGTTLRSEYLKKFGLDQRQNPTIAQQLKSVDEFLEILRRAERELPDFSLETKFCQELDRITARLVQGLDEAHTIVDGKWLVEHFAPGHTRRTQSQCRDEWTAHLRTTGGDPEILAWWRRAIAP